MSTVRYENDDAIFYFDVRDVERILKQIISEHDVPGAVRLLETIASHPADLIPIRSSYFPLIILDLLKESRGTIQCKACRRTYPAKDLKSIPVGFGKTPFSVPQPSFKDKGGLLIRLFKKRARLRMSMYGGEAYLCPEDHELISVRTWIS